MAEINKLSVGKVLDKLRRDDAPKKSKLMQLDEKAEKMERDTALQSGNTTAQVWTASWSRLTLQRPLGVKLRSPGLQQSKSASPQYRTSMPVRMSQKCQGRTCRCRPSHQRANCDGPMNVQPMLS
jgi:hypothetical protein